VRGRFLLDRLTPDSFERTTAEDLWVTVDSFLQEWDPPSTRQDLNLDGLVGSVIDNANEIFRLSENEGARHEIEGVSWILQGWAEFVAIDRRDGVVLAVVTSMD
jgi:hypothetical protein